MDLVEMKRKLTNRQLAVYVFMREFFKDNDQLPDLKSMCEKFGIQKTTAYDYFTRLQNRGYLELNAAGRFRFSRSQ